MWTSNAMSFGESFVTFLIGFSVVFICLISLAIFILIAGKIIGGIEGNIHKEVKTEAPKSTVSASPKETTNEVDQENLAIIIAAISEEMREPIDRFQIVSVKEI